MDKKTLSCFVIMPFSETSYKIQGKEFSISGDEWDYFYEHWVKKAVESYPKYTIECNRSTATPGNFVKGIVKSLVSSDLAIADLTGQKGNVFYELGIRHSFKMGTISIAQDVSFIPSDLASYYCFVYSYTGMSFNYQTMYNSFEKRLHELIDEVLKGKNYPDSPVSDFIGNREISVIHPRVDEIKIRNPFLEETFFIKLNGGGFSKVSSNDILYIEADRSYSIIHLTEGKNSQPVSLNALLNALNSEILVQVNRSVVVNINKIDSIQGNIIHIKDATIKIGDQFRSEFLRRIKFL